MESLHLVLKDGERANCSSPYYNRIGIHLNTKGK